eukprot:GHVN01044704.1.p1 GENE.GHVN01044704.1~~GHVN01044704.1.p1  ORF type:complete len:1230 (-),score=272.34 GHVN01044704.1:1509-5198(-)
MTSPGQDTGTLPCSEGESVEPPNGVVGESLESHNGGCAGDAGLGGTGVSPPPQTGVVGGGGGGGGGGDGGGGCGALFVGDEEARVVDNEGLRNRLTDEQRKGRYECMICMSTINRKAAVWECRLCYASFHLRCIQEWITKSNPSHSSSSVGINDEYASRDGNRQRATRGGRGGTGMYQVAFDSFRRITEDRAVREGLSWRCPACQLSHNEREKPISKCWCGRDKFPEVVPLGLTPHSCLQPCLRKPISNIPPISANGQATQNNPPQTSSPPHSSPPHSSPLHSSPPHSSPPHSSSPPRSANPFIIPASLPDKPPDSSDEQHQLHTSITSTSCCSHSCPLQCHPGPCPPCTVIGPELKCYCGSVTRQRACHASKPFSCEAVCGKELNCGRHKCEQVCHPGPSKPCEKMVDALCFCGKSISRVRCDSVPTGGKGGMPGYRCNLLCGNQLNCGLHKCERKCHQDKCGPCERAPEAVHYCPCGSMSVRKGNPPRTSCIDPIPTCSSVCGRRLPCSHTCPKPCHDSKCPPCGKSARLTCRCGKRKKQLPCTSITEAYIKVKDEEEAKRGERSGEGCVEPGGGGDVFEVEDGRKNFICDLVCRKKKSCGRHTCTELCCSAGNMTLEHQCYVVCNKPLNCSLHACDSLCHPGKCAPCSVFLATPVWCWCGRTSLPPPVRCGVRPQCDLVCNNPLPCGHVCKSLCHEGDCGACVTVVAKMCVGGHTVRSHVACGRTTTCGKSCGRPLNCGGGHNCSKPCHSVELSSEPVGMNSASCPKCDNVCGRKSTYCPHACSAACHGSSDCPDIPCPSMVTQTCLCGLKTAKKRCDATSACPSSLTLPTNSVTSLTCDEACQKHMRALQLARAFEKDSSLQSSTPTVVLPANSTSRTGTGTNTTYISSRQSASSLSAPHLRLSRSTKQVSGEVNDTHNEDETLTELCDDELVRASIHATQQEGESGEQSGAKLSEVSDLNPREVRELMDAMEWYESDMVEWGRRCVTSVIEVEQALQRVVEQQLKSITLPTQVRDGRLYRGFVEAYAVKHFGVDCQSIVSGGDVKTRDTIVWFNSAFSRIPEPRLSEVVKRTNGDPSPRSTHSQHPYRYNNVLYFGSLNPRVIIRNIAPHASSTELLALVRPWANCIRLRWAPPPPVKGERASQVPLIDASDARCCLVVNKHKDSKTAIIECIADETARQLSHHLTSRQSPHAFDHIQLVLPSPTPTTNVEGEGMSEMVQEGGD